MSTLKLSNDRKVSPVVVPKGAGWTPALANAFGLPAHVSCPGATDVCRRICYAARTERTFTSAGRLVAHNLRVLQDIGEDPSDLACALTAMVQTFYDQAVKLSNKRSIPLADLLVFRIHWDGDFYSVPYAKAWAITARAFPSVQFWAYTRSFLPSCNVVPDLADVPNLSLYLSVDQDNREQATAVLAEYPGVKVALLAETADAAQETLVTIGRRRAPVCPENVGRIPLTARNRADTRDEGACTACKLCIIGKADVRFSISKK